MGTDRWERLKTLFHAALEQPAERRDAWIDNVSPDPSLRTDLKNLLRAHDTAGAFLDEPPPVEPPDRIGSYEIEGELGRGGMGVVYLARDTRLQRQVAVKALPPLAPSDQTSRDRLRREARAAATITHPGVATVYALEEVDGDLFIVSEYVQGPTLREVIGNGPLHVTRALDIGVQVVRALAAAHEAGVVHRDLKPENIVLAPASGGGDLVKLVDFGIAHVDVPGLPPLTQAGAIRGTPAYMAPEQLAGVGADPRSDLYAVGVVLGEMLTGVHPLAPQAIPVPGAVKQIVSRCLASEPAARYQTARELLRDLEQAAGGGQAGNEHFWWAFHQAAAVAVYAATMLPMWVARGLVGGRTGRLLFLAALITAIVSSALRLHRWFALRWYPGEFRRVRQRGTKPLFVADALFAATIIVSGVALDASADALAIVLVSLGVGIAVSFLLIEPATTRAAFRSSARP